MKRTIFALLSITMILLSFFGSNGKVTRPGRNRPARDTAMWV